MSTAQRNLGSLISGTGGLLALLAFLAEAQTLALANPILDHARSVDV